MCIDHWIQLLGNLIRNCSIPGIAILALLLGGYIAQKHLPPPKPKVVGIDYGTTYSGIGVYEAGSGTVRVIPDSQGRNTIPSVIHYRLDNHISSNSKFIIIEENTLFFLCLLTGHMMML